MCEQFLVFVAAVAGVFNGGGSSQRRVIGTHAALPSCSRRVLQAPFLCSQRLQRPSQGRRARLNANSQNTVVQVHQVFLNFANRSSRSMPRGLRPRDFPKGKTQKTPGVGREQLERVWCSSASRTPARPALPQAPGSLLPQAPASPPRACQAPNSAPCRE